MSYTPIACAFHDRLEAWAVRRDAVEVVWTDGTAERRATAVIEDVLARDGADWVALSTGDVVRADRLVRVGGLDVPTSC